MTFDKGNGRSPFAQTTSHSSRCCRTGHILKQYHLHIAIPAKLHFLNIRMINKTNLFMGVINVVSTLVLDLGDEGCV
jgi:hypothetical protein